MKRPESRAWKHSLTFAHGQDAAAFRQFPGMMKNFGSGWTDVQVDRSHVPPPRKCCGRVVAILVGQRFIADRRQARQRARDPLLRDHDVEVVQDALTQPAFGRRQERAGSLKQHRRNSTPVKDLDGLDGLGSKPDVPLKVPLMDEVQIAPDVVRHLRAFPVHQ